jgi:molybdopterin/thiamine biosynthesis adenylyltransferase
MAEMIDARFSYEAFTQRNVGFVSAEEQSRLRSARIFVCGTGGMGGACINALVRAGIGNLAIADIDVFEISNLNRQVFAFAGTIGKPKASATADLCRQINPGLNIEMLGEEWPHKLGGIAARYPIIVNGMDHIPSGIHLYRVAREAGATVIDAYTSPLPSVTVVRAGDPRPEQRLRFPTQGESWTDISPADQAACLQREIQYVLTHSSSAKHIDLGVAAEVAAGKRSRMSFAPMVITTGNMMAYEAVQLALGRPSAADHRGYFFNPYRPAVERPRPALIARPLGLLVRRYLDKLLSTA